MLTMKLKRHKRAGALAMVRLGMIEASVQALGDEDLLDLADIFKEAATTPLTEIAAAEMRKRNISL
ncbi:hypothetical protein [Sphingomonas sp. 1P08PE]|uniref:hypothetical protein n=1 Tax=Sphingomonas sp. 1P08PE TaxID=554122 RepID=UPI0039A134C7